MLVLFVLVVATLIFRGLGFAGVHALASWHAAARYGLAVMLLFTSSAHFTAMKEDLIRMTPSWVPKPREMVFFTGLCEIAGAIGLAIPALQRAAGIALILFFLAVLPANVHAAQAQVTLRGRAPTPLWLRVPMQILFIGLAWWSTRVLAGSLHARAQEAVPLAHGNVPGEPHHHLKIENEYVRVYYVEVPPHEDTQLHQHDHDYIYVSLGPSDVVNAILNKPEIHLQLKDGETHFTRGGFAHVARNLADTPFRNITIELLKPQGEARNRCATIIGGPLQNCRQAGESREAIALRTINMPVPMFETDEVLLEGLLVKAGGGGESIASARDPARLLISLSSIKLKIRGSDQMWTNMRPGDDVWIPAGTPIDIQKIPGNVEKLFDNKEAHFLVLSFKDSVVETKP